MPRTSADPRSDLASLAQTLDQRPRGDHEVDDADIADEVLARDQYRLAGLAGLPLGVGLDIGAHVGFFSRAFLSLHPGNRVEAFEPEADNFARLCSNLAGAADQGRARCHQKAVGGHTGRGGLRRSASNTGAHRTLAAAQEGVDQEVHVVSLDDVLAGISEERIGVAKIDGEGCEYPILASASSRQLDRVDLFLMEVHWTPELAAEGCVPAAVLDRLVSEGFRPFLLEDICYPEEGRFWIVAAVHPQCCHHEPLMSHYEEARLRYSGALLHRLYGWIGRRAGRRRVDPAFHLKVSGRRFELPARSRKKHSGRAGLS